MCWGVAPSSGVQAHEFPQQAPAGSLVSRELLRSACEPFFEQMLTAMHEALVQAQMNKQSQVAFAEQAMTQTAKVSSLQALYPIHRSAYASSQLTTTFDEESTEAEESGAFASLLSGPTSESEGFDVIEPKSPETEASVPTGISLATIEDLDQTSDVEKSTMVCRHWKSKGWCRLESNCKFLHPEHKRGVGAPKTCSNGIGDISGAGRPGMSTSLSQSDAADMEVEAPPVPTVRRKRRGGRGRTNKGQQAEPGEVQQEATGTQLPVAGVVWIAGFA